MGSELYYGTLSGIPSEFRGWKFDCLRYRTDAFYIWIYKS